MLSRNLQYHDHIDSDLVYVWPWDQKKKTWEKMHDSVQSPHVSTHITNLSVEVEKYLGVKLHSKQRNKLNPIWKLNFPFIYQSFFNFSCEFHQEFLLPPCSLLAVESADCVPVWVWWLLWKLPLLVNAFSVYIFSILQRWLPLRVVSVLRGQCMLISVWEGAVAISVTALVPSFCLHRQPCWYLDALRHVCSLGVAHGYLLPGGS